MLKKLPHIKRKHVHLGNPKIKIDNYSVFLIQCVPLATEPGWLADRCSVPQQLGTLQIHTTDTFLFISHTTNVLLFKFLCNIFIRFRIIKEMPGFGSEWDTQYKVSLLVANQFLLIYSSLFVYSLSSFILLKPLFLALTMYIPCVQNFLKIPFFLANDFRIRLFFL